MKHKMRLFSIIVLAAAFLAFPGEVHADIAPPINPPGSNVQPGDESTQVRMVAEKVVLEVIDDRKEEGLGKAHVTADFSMRNLGSEVETMQVRFPMSANDGRGDYPEITGVSVKVDGKPVTTNLTSYEEPNYFSDLVPWVEFEVTFPPGEDVAISVAYDLQGSGYYPYTAFYYLLETGAGWKDTIGKAEIILRLPYEASALNVVQDFPIGWAQTNRKAIFDGNEVRWLYEDFEPGPFAVVQNMEFVLVAPGAWKKVLQAQEEAKANPTDGEAWGRLAKGYKELFLLSKGYRNDPGGNDLYQLSVEAYEECLRLKPSDAQWHAGFADLLAQRAYLYGWNSGPTQDAFRALAEIHTALEIAPNDPKVKEIAQNISWLFPEGMRQSEAGYDFPWLTQTPTPLPPTKTSAPALDPIMVSGEYTSPWLTLWDGQLAELRLILKPDYSAGLQTIFQGQEPEQIEQGVWKDDGDGLLRLVMAWPNGDPYTLVFRVEDGSLDAIEYPSYFGEGGVIMDKPAEIQAPTIETAQPRLTLTLEPTRTATTQPIQSATPTSQSTPAPDKTEPGAKSGLQCFSIGLVPLAAVGYLWRRKWRGG